MENITRALIMAFSMLIFVIAFSYAMYLINKATATSDVLLESITTSKYYDNIEVSGSDVATREVGIDTIIPVLYRYYKENYAVKIYDGNTLIQIFDVNLESKIARAAAYTKTGATADQELVSLKGSIYNNNGNKFTSPDSATRAYLFEAPWTGSTDEDTRSRIDYFLNGEKGYINNTLVDYTKDGGFIKKYGGETFYESFVEYAYSGETISTENGLETITGNTQESNKIIITYTLK